MSKFKKNYEHLGGDIVFKVDSQSKNFISYCVDNEKNLNPICNNNCRHKLPNEKFVDATPCPNRPHLKKCKEHKKKFFIQTNTNLIIKGIDCAFCHIEKNPTCVEDDQDVKKFLDSPMTDSPEITIKKNKNFMKNGLQLIPKYLNKFVMINLTKKPNENMMKIETPFKKNISQSEPVISSYQRELLIELLNATQDPNQAEKIYNEFVKDSADRKVFVIEVKNKSKYVVKIETDEITGLEKEEATILFQRRMEYTQNTSNSVHRKFSNAPFIHKYIVLSHPQQQRKVTRLTSFMLMDYVEGRTLQEMNDIDVMSLSGRKDVNGPFEFAMLWGNCFDHILRRFVRIEKDGYHHGDFSLSNIIIPRLEEVQKYKDKTRFKIIDYSAIDPFIYVNPDVKSDVENLFNLSRYVNDKENKFDLNKGSDLKNLMLTYLSLTSFFWYIVPQPEVSDLMPRIPFIPTKDNEIQQKFNDDDFSTFLKYRDSVILCLLFKQLLLIYDGTDQNQTCKYYQIINDLIRNGVSIGLKNEKENYPQSEIDFKDSAEVVRLIKEFDIVKFCQSFDSSESDLVKEKEVEDMLKLLYYSFLSTRLTEDSEAIRRAGGESTTWTWKKLWYNVFSKVL